MIIDTYRSITLRAMTEFTIRDAFFSTVYPIEIPLMVNFINPADRSRFETVDSSSMSITYGRIISQVEKTPFSRLEDIDFTLEGMDEFYNKNALFGKLKMHLFHDKLSVIKHAGFGHHGRRIFNVMLNIAKYKNDKIPRIASATIVVPKDILETAGL